MRYSINEPPTSNILKLFSINEDTGDLFLKKSAEKYENKNFQFFVRAADNGISPLHSDTPVEVKIVPSAVVLPVFEKKERKPMFISESATPGSIIARVKLAGNVTAKYSLTSVDDSQFLINDEGEISLAKTLDREKKDVHVIGVTADVDGLLASMDISLHVQDENDNAPIFESNPYNLYLAENVEKGTSIMKVTARDLDSGANGELRYYLAENEGDGGDVVNIFAIDVYTGWITTLVPLDKESKSEYRFHVIGTDLGEYLMCFSD